MRYLVKERKKRKAVNSSLEKSLINCYDIPRKILELLSGYIFSAILNVFDFVLQCL